VLEGDHDDCLGSFSSGGSIILLCSGILGVVINNACTVCMMCMEVNQSVRHLSTLA
jgi:hypothetical protein